MKHNKNKNLLPLASLEFYLENNQSLADDSKKNTDISSLIDVLNVNYWTSEITVNVFQKEYDALVLTDKTQKIRWVSSGFRKMTGYPKQYALGKRPNFLQGELTCKTLKKRIRKELENKHSFSGAIVNYKKNGEPYNCLITILPLYTKKENLKYFLAFEKEITMSQQQIDSTKI